MSRKDWKHVRTHKNLLFYSRSNINKSGLL